jgi:hypothetical protein
VCRARGKTCEAPIAGAPTQNEAKAGISAAARLAKRC